MKKILAFVICLLTLAVSTAQEITLEEIVSGKFSQKGIRGIHPLSDGESYSQISADGRQIVRCSFKDGKSIETLFDITSARGPRLASFSGYVMSPDEKNILIETNRNSIYRHSFTAEFYIYNIKNKTMVHLSTG